MGAKGGFTCRPVGGQSSRLSHGCFPGNPVAGCSAGSVYGNTPLPERVTLPADGLPFELLSCPCLVPNVCLRSWGRVSVLLQTHQLHRWPDRPTLVVAGPHLRRCAWRAGPWRWRSQVAAGPVSKGLSPHGVAASDLEIRKHRIHAPLVKSPVTEGTKKSTISC